MIEEGQTVMPEYGGYLQLESYDGTLFHENAVALNTGRNALGYLIETRGISEILLPDYLCDSIAEVCERYGVKVNRYAIGMDLRPQVLPDPSSDQWFYVVNYFGQLSNDEVREIADNFPRTIVDNAQSFFTLPLHDVDTIYTCRKFFGVPDGAFLYTSTSLGRPLQQDVSSNSMTHILGRFEADATSYYAKFRESESSLVGRPVARMSSITENLLRAVDFGAVSERRRNNFAVLRRRLESLNLISPKADSGPYHYPLLIADGEAVRVQLHHRRVFAPTLWPNVLVDSEASDVATTLARSLIPLPVDQRYTEEDMHAVADIIEEAIDAL